MNRIILASGKTLDVESVTFEPHFVVPCASWDAFIDLVDLMTTDNLQRIQVIKDEQVAAVFTDCELVGTQTINSYDGSMIVHIYLTGLPAETNSEYKAAYQIMSGEVQA